MSNDDAPVPEIAVDPLQKLGEIRKWSGDLEIAFTKLHERLRTLGADNERFREAYRELKGDASFKEQELRHKLTSLQDKWREAKERLQAQAHELKSNEREISVLRELQGKAEQDKQTIERNLSDSLARANRYVNSLHERTTAIQKALGEEKTARAALELELNRIKSLLSEQEQRALSLQSQASEVGLARATSEAEAQRVTEALRERNTQLQSYRQREAQLRNSYEFKMQTLRNDTAVQIQNVQGEAAAQIHNVQIETAAQIHNLQVETAAQLQTLRSESSAQIQKLEAALELEKSMHAQEKSRLVELQTDIMDSQAELVRLRSESATRIKALEDQLVEARLKGEILDVALQSKKEDYIRHQSESQQKLRDLESRLLDEESRADTLDRLLRSRSEDNARLKTRLQQLEFDRMVAQMQGVSTGAASSLRESLAPPAEEPVLPPPPRLDIRRIGNVAVRAKDETP
jgi:hypothetical protein